MIDDVLYPGITSVIKIAESGREVYSITPAPFADHGLQLCSRMICIRNAINPLIAPQEPHGYLLYATMIPYKSHS